MRSSKILLNSNKKITVYRSTSNNPFVNLAIENYLFSNPKDNNEYTLYLWRNGPSVIIGKFQSAWRECNVLKMNDEKVNLVRRPSGGGAVYQDLGNSIFTFLSPKLETNSIQNNNTILLNALKSFNIIGEATGRNDLHVNNRKISGAAFRNTKDRSLHHGTLLLNVDMTALSRYLTPNKVKLQSKGVSSVEAHVLNLQTIAPTITHENIGKAITESFFKFHNTTCDIIDIDESIVEKEIQVKKVVDQLENWDWRFGSKEPAFTNKLETTRLSWGTFDVNFIVNKGIIDNITIYCDALDVPLIESIQSNLKGKEYSHDSIKNTLNNLQLLPTSNKEHVYEFTEWLINKL